MIELKEHMDDHSRHIMLGKISKGEVVWKHIGYVHWHHGRHEPHIEIIHSELNFGDLRVSNMREVIRQYDAIRQREEAWHKEWAAKQPQVMP